MLKWGNIKCEIIKSSSWLVLFEVEVILDTGYIENFQLVVGKPVFLSHLTLFWVLHSITTPFQCIGNSIIHIETEQDVLCFCVCVHCSAKKCLQWIREHF